MDDYRFADPRLLTASMIEMYQAAGSILPVGTAALGSGKVLPPAWTVPVSSEWINVLL
jgi:hypothetical protein